MNVITPYLRVKDAGEAIAFYQKAFGAVELYRLTDPNGVTGHAEFTIGGALVQISNEFPEYGIKGPQTLGGTSVGIHLRVENADQVFEQAVAAGAAVASPLADQFFGERSGSVTDPFGHYWMITTKTEEVTPDEMQRRYTAMYE
ncbi:MAG: Glyoxalase family protein [Paenibacillus sp.]|jgi:uncharacterized glyoxalase superfamily protein PhnB|nr:Glyoxalase family protein [Paenibacillus sp.]